MTTVTAHARLRHDQAGPLLLQLAPTETASERLVVDGADNTRELLDPYGGRHHLLDAGAGLIDIAYEAEVTTRPPAPELEILDRLKLLRPSRYCPSDLMADPPVTHLDEVEGWVHSRLRYELGASGPGEDALQTLDRGTGVCRDFAHVVVTICRALDVPARVFSCYAPGLVPQDFHLVAEAWDGEGWRTIDATRLVDPSLLIRIGTGRDAADTAWLSTWGPPADLELIDVQVT